MVKKKNHKKGKMPNNETPAPVEVNSEPQPGNLNPVHQNPAVHLLPETSNTQKITKPENTNPGTSHTPKEEPETTLRAKPGIKGKECKLQTNFLVLLDVEKMASKAYQYNVIITPNTPKKFMDSVFETFQMKIFKSIVLSFDGTSIAYSTLKNLIKNQTLEDSVEIVDPKSSRLIEYKVSLAETNIEIDLTELAKYVNNKEEMVTKPLVALNCINSVLRSPCIKSGIAVKQTFYSPPDKSMDLSVFSELYTGLFQSVVLGSKMFLNVDIVHKAFTKEVSIIDVIKPVNTNESLKFYQINDLNDNLQDFSIIYELPGNIASRRTYKFIRFIKETPSQKQFKMEDGRTITIQEYFKTIKNLNLRYPNLPCIEIGSSVRTIFVPAEFCRVAGGQVINKKLNSDQTTQMIRHAATIPDIRKQKIVQLVNRIKHNEDSLIKSFGIRINSEFEHINGRVLDSPQLQYFKKVIIPKEGVWRNVDNGYIDPKNILKWAIVVMDSRNTNHSDIINFGNKIVSAGKYQNMIINKDFEIINAAVPYNYHNIFNDLIKHKFEIAFFLLPRKQENTYEKIKTYELLYKILSPCIKNFTLQKLLKDPGILNNILKKNNAKLNGNDCKLYGTNSRTPILDKPVMIMGADVNHPSPGLDRKIVPSIVGSSASFDKDCSNYKCTIRIQFAGEMIMDMKSITMEYLKYFHEKNGNFPEHIIYFRDGVSDAEFSQVNQIERTAIYAACAQMQPLYKPKVTIIIVQKRHHTRLFPVKAGPGLSLKNGNVLPGTVVDTQITDPNKFQFYMVAQASIQGTARPAKYTIIHDDSSINVNMIQTLTHSLCYVNSRCDRAVSYITPTAYSHWSAAKGRILYQDPEFKNKAEKLVQLFQEMSHKYPMFAI